MAASIQGVTAQSRPLLYLLPDGQSLGDGSYAVWLAHISRFWNVYVNDTYNRRVVRVDFTYAAEAKVAAK